MSLPRDRAATVQGTSKYGVVGAGAGASSPLERSLRAQARLARKLRVVRRLAYWAAKRAAAAKQALVVPPCDLHQPDVVAPAPEASEKVSSARPATAIWSQHRPALPAQSAPPLLVVGAFALALASAVASVVFEEVAAVALAGLLVMA